MFNSFQSEVITKNGLEALYSEKNVKVSEGKKKILVGVDGGSTTTRVTILDDIKNLASLDVVYAIPSDYGEKIRDEILIPQSTSLYDRLESSVIPQDADTSYVPSTTILRGPLKFNTACRESSISSIDQKLDSVGFYLNIIDAIGYSIIQKYGVNCLSSFDVYLTASLRPNDVNTDIRQKQFISRLQGTYTWKNVFLGATIEINILKVAVQTEAEAQEKGYFVRNGKKAPVCFATFEVGGSSVGTSIMKNGVKLDKAEKPLAYGGAYLLELFTNCCLNSGKLNYTPSLEVLEEAINNGYLKIGKTKISVVKEICDAKDKFAVQIAEDFRVQILSKITNFNFAEVEEVFFGGRVFNCGDFGEFAGDDDRVFHNGYSLAKPLVKELKKLNDGFVYHLIRTNMIPFSNCMLSAKNFGGVLKA